MTININDYFLSREEKKRSFDPAISLPIGIMNYPKILALSKKDFAEFYLKLMEQYRDYDGWWGEKGIPYCSNCNEEISGPRDLRRLAGRSLHPNCFAKEMNLKEEKGLIKKYWKRVLEVDFSLLDN